MKKIIHKITEKSLDALDMHMDKCINSEEYKTYFNGISSTEHYRLLSYLSIQFNSETIIDIGTLKGCSALALSTNPTNEVISFNLDNQLDLNNPPDNIEFIIGDCLHEQYKDIIMKSKIILLDTYHDGTFEEIFYSYLKDNNYSGTLLLDDIKLNDEMIQFWNNIDLPKEDITNLGHWSGTGVVYFNE